MASRAILQAHLDEVSFAILQDDWETYRKGITLPCAVITHRETKLVMTEADLTEGFDDFRSTLRSLRVTDYIRLVDQAIRLDEDLISGSYVSHVISGGQRIMAPFQSTMTSRQAGRRWCETAVCNGLANSRWPLVLHCSAAINSEGSVT